MKQSAAVSVPATSANLGPGYDCLGLALAWRDRYAAEVRWAHSAAAATQPRVTVDVRGEGAEEVGGPDNLVARALLTGLRRFGGSDPDELHLTCENTIPHGRGLGSSSAAIVGGLGLARELLEADVDDAALLELACEIEGHPDNVAPAVLGGVTISWTDEDGRGRALRRSPHPDLAAVLAVPEFRLATAAARRLLPEAVPLADAVFNLSRAALLVAALTDSPELLLAATEDRLHQPHRAPAYAASMAMVTESRLAGRAAVISGAGPTVLLLTTDDPAVEAAAVAEYADPHWTLRVIAVSEQGLRPEVE